MKKRVKITSKKVADKIDSLIAAHVLTGGKMPMRIVMGNRAYKIANNGLQRDGVRFDVGRRCYKLDMHVATEYEPFDMGTINALFKQVYLPHIQQQLQNHSSLMQWVKRTPR